MSAYDAFLSLNPFPHHQQSAGIDPSTFRNISSNSADPEDDQKHLPLKDVVPGQIVLPLLQKRLPVELAIQVASYCELERVAYGVRENVWHSETESQNMEVLASARLKWRAAGKGKVRDWAIAVLVDAEFTDDKTSRPHPLLLRCRRAPEFYQHRFDRYWPALGPWNGTGRSTQVRWFRPRDEEVDLRGWGRLAEFGENEGVLFQVVVGLFDRTCTDVVVHRVELAVYAGVGTQEAQLLW